MQHSPLYPQCDWNHRVIAVQARCLLTQDDLERYASIITPDFSHLIELIYLAIQDGFLPSSLTPHEQDDDDDDNHKEDEKRSERRIVFTSPTLQEILIVQQELTPLWEEKKKSSRCVTS
jgi:hypothetical protein